MREIPSADSPPRRAKSATPRAHHAHLGGYDKESAAVNSLGAKYYDYIVAQDAVAAHQELPLLHQYDFAAFTKDNAALYYLADGYHLTAQGYETLAWYHLYFLATGKTYTGLITK